MWAVWGSAEAGLLTNPLYSGFPGNIYHNEESGCTPTLCPPRLVMESDVQVKKDESDQITAFLAQPEHGRHVAVQNVIVLCRKERGALVSFIAVDPRALDNQSLTNSHVLRIETNMNRTLPPTKYEDIQVGAMINAKGTLYKAQYGFYLETRIPERVGQTTMQLPVHVFRCD